MPKTKKRKKPSTRPKTPGQVPRDGLGRRTTGSIATTRKVIAIVGNLVGAVALLVAICAVVWLLLHTAGGGRISEVFPDDIGGTETIAFPTLMAGLSMIGFFFGQYAVRGRWEVVVSEGKSGGSFGVHLRPISVRLHVLLLGLTLAAWALVMVVPVVLDAQGILDIPLGSSAVDQFWFTVTVYGVLTGILAAMISLSLFKKLTYNDLLARHSSTIVPGSARQLWWAKFSHIWRAELGIAGFAGAALGLSPLGVHLDSPAYGFGALAIGIALMTVAVLLARNSWRSGLAVERVGSYI
ncbi:hypothetical protein [Microbacterium sp. zg-YB36]|uniref:hypothetical protein n=1 Tax=Microbacterium sp. zg-YB36 TaxID=2969407 RepID=UPI00214C93E9|nr:hypothetical protein [Microbacterium sp. zg-YB36]MDL5350381.1 hypothetical protein [Microbacterium sp. zg-YB36]